VQRRSYRQLKAAGKTDCHHNVYVVLLDPKAASDPALQKANPRRKQGLPCVYVGMTGLTPEDRLANHKKGHKAADVVQRHGIRLLPELYDWLNPMPFAAAAQMERDLAEDLRHRGYTVAGGH
jgi:hypothetical protein